MSKKRAAVILERFNKAKQKRIAKDPVWKELDAFDRNQQWELSGTASWVPKPITNYLHLVKYTKRAAFAIDNPTGKLRPLSPAGVEQVRILDKAYQDTFDRIKARKVVRENIETAKLLGTAIAQVYWDESKEGRMGTTVLGDEGFQYEGEIGIKEIEPATFFPDPNAFRIQECDYIIIRERKTSSWIKEKFQSDTEEESGTNDPNERGEIYLRDYATSQEKLVDFISYYEKELNAEGGYTYFVTYMANGKILKDKQTLRPNRYPFAVLYDFPQRQDFWGMSTCQFIIDNQKIINKVESIITMIGLLLQNPQKVVARDSGINPKEVAKYGNAPQKVWVANGDPSRAIHYVTPPQIPQPLFNLVDTAKNNIREVTGLTESYMGQNVGSLQTSSGVQALIDRATIRDRDQAYDVELYIEELSKLIIDFMTTYYEQERQVRILGKKSTDDVEFMPFVGVEFRDLEYDIAIDVSAKAPLTRMKEMNDAKELLSMQGQYGDQYPVQILKPQEAIRMMNLANAENIIERMDTEEAQNKSEQAMQIANMMMEAANNGVPQDEVMQMGMSMFEQMDNPNAQSQAGDPTTANPQNRPQGA